MEYSRTVRWWLPLVVLLGCTGPEPCDGPADCNDETWGPLCDPELMQCTECIAEEDCPAFTEHCVREYGICGCLDDGDCASDAPYCNGRGVCRECVSTADCPPRNDCVSGECELDPDL